MAKKTREPRKLDIDPTLLSEDDRLAIRKEAAASIEAERRGAELQARRSAKQEQGRANSYKALLQIERQRGYKPGWARHVLYARRGAKANSFGDESKRDHKNSDKLTSLADSFRP